MSKFQIQRYQVAIAVAHGAVASFKVQNVPLNGILLGHKLKSSAAGDGTPTITLNLKDADGDAVYSKASLATNTTTITDLTADQAVALASNFTIEALFSANQTVTDQTVTVTLLIQRG
ncbi:MAG TPA: hypothetical protein VH234_06225 [Candidatus Saccharimonadales bacterium]|jgi:hypothetical protein|nr:hypothetical protein [Candidatus Saccharimonadales bacterium]